AAVAPDRGPTTGGSAVRITGSGFDGTTGVSFGGIPAPSFDVRSGMGGRVLEVIAPAHGTGVAPISVTTPAGASGPARTFTFQHPSGHWSAVAAQRRFSHTATLLNDGRVLVAGGCVQPEPTGQCRRATATAELYDPANRSWSPTADMGTARIGHLATLLPDGKVLVSGGCSTLSCRPECPTVDCPPLSPSELSAEFYDPTSGRWSPTADMAFIQEHATATLLPAGPAAACGSSCSKVLVVGSGATLDGTPAASDAQLYDPRAGSWTATAPTVHTRDYPAAVVLRTGKVLVTSTASDQPMAAIPAELYDPATATWAPTGNSELTPNIGETATLLPDGRVLAVAGETNIDSTQARPDVELYDPTALPDPTNPAVRGGAWKTTGGPSDRRTGNTATRLKDGTVLVVGGNRPPIATAELYDGKKAAWSSAGSMGGARGVDPLGSAGRPTFTATLLKDGTVLVVGASYTVSRLRTTFNSHAPSGFQVGDPDQYGPSAELYTPSSRRSGGGLLGVALVVGAAAGLAALAAALLLRRRTGRRRRRAVPVPG
ncbi:MAG: hypothetical protein M3137_07960, partial [Actinomycetota bacterium]|nr:hypothetical protein [Actinomycetota bacterium]